ncbi:MAG: DUF2157 domain-containing protein [Pseudomonadota bacterium]
MSLADRLSDWQTAGLIDAATAARIAAHEDARSRPVVLWAVIALGCLALALGIVSLVASQWFAIPDGVKLGGHMLLTIGTAATVWRTRTHEALWWAEGALFLLATLVLTGLALHAQIYQLTGDIWRLLMAALLLAGPALAIAGQTRLTAYALIGLAMWATISWASAVDGGGSGHLLVQGLAIAVPWLALALAAFVRDRSAFASGLTEAAAVVILVSASLIHIAWADPVTGADAADMAVRFAVALPAAALAIRAQRTHGPLPRQFALPLIAIPFLAAALAVALPHGNGPLPRFVGALIYAAMWGGVGWVAAQRGWRTLFGIAIGALALRLFIIYFELFGTLATTGFGLVMAGALLIGIALAWRRIFKRFGS